jgi:hypothetical protein
MKSYVKSRDERLKDFKIVKKQRCADTEYQEKESVFARNRK